VLKRSSKSKGGRLPTALKLKAIKRVERGEGVVAVSRDLGVTRGQRVLRPVPVPAESKSSAQRIAELERVIGRQQLELDFFRQALRALEGTPAQGKKPLVSRKLSKT
jgi:transposase